MTLIVHCAKRLTTCTYLVSIITQQSIIFIHFKDRYLLYWTSGIWTQICRAWKPSSFQLGTQIPGKEFLTFSKDWGYWSAVSFPSQMWTDANKGVVMPFLFFFSGTPAGWGGLGWQELRVICSFLTALPEASWWRGKDFPSSLTSKVPVRGSPGQDGVSKGY